jgi:hypothetical protein
MLTDRQLAYPIAGGQTNRASKNADQGRRQLGVGGMKGFNLPSRFHLSPDLRTPAAFNGMLPPGVPCRASRIAREEAKDHSLSEVPP